ncbi:MAG: LamG domain-containing protein, partial [Phycisphaerae bacterium]|nr:LamG domain-containing protein [Phycisphaerae bacterium]
MLNNRRSPLFFYFLLIAMISGNAYARGHQSVLGWHFDQVQDGKVIEFVSGEKNSLSGHSRLVDGVKGQAIVMDGYTTCVTVAAKQGCALQGAFTLEAWTAMGAYPWNWAPLLAQENTRSKNSNQDKICWPDDILVDSDKQGFFFGVSPQGHLGLHIGSGDQWQVYRTEKKLALRKWTHVAVSFNKEAVVFYMDGRKVTEIKPEITFSQARSEDLRIGMPHQKIEPSDPVRAFATLPTWYSLDGLIDEVQVYASVLDEKTISSRYTATQPATAPSLPPR